MLEQFHGQPGFRSLTTLVSRETGECLGISVWETSSQAGGTVTAPDVDVYEVGLEARAVDVP